MGMDEFRVARRNELLLKVFRDRNALRFYNAVHVVRLIYELLILVIGFIFVFKIDQDVSTHIKFYLVVNSAIQIMKVAFLGYLLYRISKLRRYRDLTLSISAEITEICLYTFNLIWSFFGTTIFFEHIQPFYI